MLPKEREDLARRVTEVLRPYVSEARQRRIREVLEARTRAVVVLLEDVLNDHNGAAVLRTADALGLMEAHVIPGPEGFKVSRRVAQGSQKWIEVTRHSDVDGAYRALRARGFEVWASAVHGDAVPVGDLPASRPVALVFGNEHAGLSRSAVSKADGRFHVPMFGFVESLNISVAAALALEAVVGSRRRAGALEGLSPADRAIVEADWYATSVRASSQLLTRAGLGPWPPAPADYDLVDEARS